MKNKVLFFVLNQILSSYMFSFMHETVSANPVQYLDYEKENFKHNTNPNHPGPCVCKFDTNIGASPLKELNIQRCLAHIQPSQAQIFQNIISKSVCLLGTTTGVIRVNQQQIVKLAILTF